MFYPLALPEQLLRSLLLFGGLWLLFLPPAAAQPAPPSVRIERLPPAGLLLQKGWRYHLGDDPAWARPDFDDRGAGWDTLNPSRLLQELPPRLAKSVSWLRLRLRPTDSLYQQALLLQADRNQPGAYELYLNGRLVQHQGLFAADLTRVHPAGSRPEPVELPSTGPADLVLAVRYAPSQQWLPSGFGQQPLFALRLWDSAALRQSERVQAEANPVFLVMGCVVGLLMLLHIAFFYYNPARRANLYFTFYTGALSLAALDFYFGRIRNFATADWRATFASAAYVLLCLSSLWAVRALYALFGFRPGKVYLGLCLSCGLLVGYSVFFASGVAVFSTFLAAIFLATTEQLRLTARVLRRLRGGARIIGVGFALVLLLLLGMAVLTVTGLKLSPMATSLTFVFNYLPSALAISLFLAREFALDAELLLVKLREVEQLSAQTLAQEQEKQTLLAAQNDTLETQVQQRTVELQRSLTDLRTTQAQLIQKEKMASLGELTAGIAHEIQNPLNFVNNFSEVSAELMLELEEAQAAGDGEEVTALATDVRQNLTKISQHGQRAASIVRGMLEHSRQSTGERAPVDISALCDEYLRLAYHGLRAKDKTFNADLKTDFAPTLPLVEGVGPDLGRVLLNLFNNAFYAVQQRQLAGELGYAPTVGVSTKQVGSQVEIRVSDNGTGMPLEVQQKIFQPFFTTKPTGEGTGLGLSLSHDIIAQGHGGTLTVESQPGQGTTFIITLPA